MTASFKLGKEIIHRRASGVRACVVGSTTDNKATGGVLKARGGIIQRFILIQSIEIDE